MPKLSQKETSTTTKITTSPDGAKTFQITKEVQGLQGGHAVFILLYPTRTAENHYIDDSTNTHLMKHLEEMELNSYSIVNLFATVTQSRLSMRGLTVDEENMTFLKEQVFAKLQEGNTKVVVAWGNSQQNSPVVVRSKQRILELWEETQPGGILYQLTAEGMKKENLGSHPLFLGIRHSNSVWKLKTYPYKRVLKEFIEQEKQKRQKQ